MDRRKDMSKGIILGIGILILLLALAGTSSASMAFGVSPCDTCHTTWSGNTPTGFTAPGTIFNNTHRADATTPIKDSVPACANCHVNVAALNFGLLSDTPTYLGSETCENCHKAKYDKWSNTLHAVMLTPKAKAMAMGLPTPPIGWDEVSYVIITKFQLAYINTTGWL